MNNTESVLKTPVTREVALKFSNDVFDKRTTWEKEAVRFNIDGATLRRYCVELLGSDFRGIVHSGLVILTKADAIKMNADVVARKTSWTALGRRYNVSDNAVRKKCEVLLGTEVTNVLKDGVRLEFDCSNCNTHFTRMNYDVKNPDAKEFFCKLQCQIDWQKKHTSKGPSTDEAWYAFYVKSVNEELSLRAMARALQMDHTVLAKHLHNKGIRMGSKSIIEKDKLKSFVRKFPDVGNVSE